MIVETVWWRLRYGFWQAHFTLLWLPLCTVYGFGAVGCYLGAVIFYEQSTLFRFAAYAIAGTLVEFVGGFLLDAGLKMRAWDYRDKKPVLTMQDLYGKTVLLPEKTRATTFAATLFKLFSSEPQIRIKALAETEARFSFIKIQHCISFCTAEYILNHDAFSYIPFQDVGEFTYGFASLTEFTQPMKKLIRQFEQWISANEANAPYH